MKRLICVFIEADVFERFTIASASNCILFLFAILCHWKQSKPGQSGSGANKPLSSSSPNSPLLTHRSSSLERGGRYVSAGQPQRLTLTRQKSDMSHDRERPFVSVKHAHEQHAKALNSANGGQVRCSSSLSRSLPRVAKESALSRTSSSPPSIKSIHQNSSAAS